MYGNNPAPPPKKTGNLTMCKVGILLCKLSNDENNDKPSFIGDVSSSQHVPWHSNFHGYLNSRDQLRTMTIVEWWGVCTQNEYPMLGSQLGRAHRPHKMTQQVPYQIHPLLYISDLFTIHYPEQVGTPTPISK